MSSIQMALIPASSWRSEAQALVAEGFTHFDQLGGRSLSDGFEIWLRVGRPASPRLPAEWAQRRVVISQISELATLGDLWWGARWCEAELGGLIDSPGLARRDATKWPGYGDPTGRLNIQSRFAPLAGSGGADR